MKPLKAHDNISFAISSMISLLIAMPTTEASKGSAVLRRYHCIYGLSSVISYRLTANCTGPALTSYVVLSRQILLQMHTVSWIRTTISARYQCPCVGIAGSIRTLAGVSYMQLHELLEFIW